MSGERDSGEPRDPTLIPRGAPPPPAARAIAGRGSDEIGEGHTLILPGSVSARLPEIPGVVITAEIGRGGMGIVYRGNQSYLDRDVAVKLLGDQHRGGDFEARFRREAKILAGITHPNIVACYQAGLTQDGKAYLVMEYIDGPNLQECLEQNGCLAPELALVICRDMAQALAHAYEAGIIHRDVKPANVLLQKKERAKLGDPFPYRPKLADLGLARYEGKSTTRVDLTMKGAVMGSPPTMAPEQFDDPESVDFRTDIYGLGCVLFHALTGKLAFGQSSLTALIAKKMEPVGPDPRKHRPELSAPIAELCMKMLACQRDGRPASYAELTDRLNALLPPTQPRTTDVAFAAARKSALESRQRGEEPDSWLTVLRRKWPVAAAIAAGVLAIAGAVYVLQGDGTSTLAKVQQNPTGEQGGPTHEGPKADDPKNTADPKDDAQAGAELSSTSGATGADATGLDETGPDATGSNGNDDESTSGNGDDTGTREPSGGTPAVEPKSYLSWTTDVTGADAREVILRAVCVDTPTETESIRLFAGGRVLLPRQVDDRKQRKLDLSWSIPAGDKASLATLEPGGASGPELVSKRSKVDSVIALEVRARYVDDGTELSATPTVVRVVFTGGNKPPTATIRSKTGRRDFAIDQPIQLTADVVDPDQDDVRLEWTILDAKGARKATLEERSTELKWKAPRTLDGDFEHVRFQLVVDDGLDVDKSEPIDIWCNVDEMISPLTPDDRTSLFKSIGAYRSENLSISKILEGWDGSFTAFHANYGLPVTERLIGPKTSIGKCGEVSYTLPAQGSWRFEGIAQLFYVDIAEGDEPGLAPPVPIRRQERRRTAAARRHWRRPPV